MQGILSNTLIRLETATIESEAQAAEELVAMRNHEWDLGNWVQLRVRLLSLSNAVHYLLVGTQHISMDGHGVSLLMIDVNNAYIHPGKSVPPLPEASQARSFGKQQLLAYRAGNSSRPLTTTAEASNPLTLSGPSSYSPLLAHRSACRSRVIVLTCPKYVSSPSQLH